jgi:hypothetical protein
MQPKRDPNDRRYWPVRAGGTGKGFARSDRETHPLRYRAIDNPRSIDAVHNRGRTAEGIRTRARLILERALDKVEDELRGDNPLPLKDLNATVAALGRIAGVQSMEVNQNVTVLTPEQRDARVQQLLRPYISATATLANPMSPNALAPSPKETP